MMFIIDAHLDLAYNATLGRDLTKPARQQPKDEEGTPAVGLPDLAGAAMICGTIFCEPATARGPEHGYSTADEAHAAAMVQMRWYHEQQDEGRMRIVSSASQVPGGGSQESGVRSQESADGRQIPYVMLLEGSDPLRGEADVAAFHQMGLRIVGLAWHRTRHAGGTGEPGPLTDEGVGLVRILDRYRIIHDISHLAEESFWQLLDLTAGPVIASHSNCRAIIPTDRQLSDEMIRGVAGRGGVIGMNLFDKFLIPPPERQRRRATLADAVAHVKHMCDLLGDAKHVGIGTDIDGGFGRENLPVEIETWADLPRFADALSAGGFGDADVAGIMGGNWAEFFRRALPRATTDEHR